MVAVKSAYPHFAFFSVVCDLGFTLDQELTLALHIHSLCRAYYYQLHQLYTVARSLSLPQLHLFISLLLLGLSTVALFTLVFPLLV